MTKVTTPAIAEKAAELIHFSIHDLLERLTLDKITQAEVNEIESDIRAVAASCLAQKENSNG